MMNAKAAALGLTDTHFTNPHGLDAPGHYTSARDLATLGRYAMRNPEFRRIVAMRKVASSRRRRAVDGCSQTTDALLRQLRRARGHQDRVHERRRLQLRVARRSGTASSSFGVVLGTRASRRASRRRERLLDWGFSHYRATRLGHRGHRRSGRCRSPTTSTTAIVAVVAADRGRARCSTSTGRSTRRYDLRPLGHRAGAGGAAASATSR